MHFLVILARKYMTDVLNAIISKVLCMLFTSVSAIFENKFFKIMIPKIVPHDFFHKDGIKILLSRFFSCPASYIYIAPKGVPSRFSYKQPLNRSNIIY